MIKGFAVVIEVDEKGWFVGRVPALKFQTRARTLTELYLDIKDGIQDKFSDMSFVESANKIFT